MLAHCRIHLVEDFIANCRRQLDRALLMSSHANAGPGQMSMADFEQEFTPEKKRLFKMAEAEQQKILALVQATRPASA